MQLVGAKNTTAVGNCKRGSHERGYRPWSGIIPWPPFAAVGVKVCQRSLNLTSVIQRLADNEGYRRRQRTQWSTSVHIILEFGYVDEKSETSKC